MRSRLQTLATCRRQVIDNENNNFIGDFAILRCGLEARVVMKTFCKIIAAGVFAVLAFDTVASYASLYFGFPYTDAVIGSAVIYCAVGYVCFRCYALIKVVTAALMVGLVDATLGWYISWVIGPGALSLAEKSYSIIVIGVFLIVILSIVCSLIGAGIARFIHGSKK